LAKAQILLYTSLRTGTSIRLRRFFFLFFFLILLAFYSPEELGSCWQQEEKRKEAAVVPPGVLGRIRLTERVGVWCLHASLDACG
jgi:ABC-type transport system involved in cytochrome c biogenesis permease subunit